MAFELLSDAFDAGEAIPIRHTCDGEDRSPALHWRGVPDAADSLVLVCDDPDAPGKTWSHWVLYGMPVDPARDRIEEGVPGDRELSWGARQGRNDFGDVGYGGPCPPRGHGPHRYFFRLYALDAALEMPPGLTRQQVLERIEGHVVDQAELMGTYERTA